MNKYSTRSLSTSLVDEVLQSIKQVEGFGSVEIYIQDNVVTQITVRQIKKTSSQKQTLDKPVSLY